MSKNQRGICGLGGVMAVRVIRRAVSCYSELSLNGRWIVRIAFSQSQRNRWDMRWVRNRLWRFTSIVILFRRAVY